MVSAVFCAVCAHAEKTCLAAKMLHGGGVAATHSTAVYQCVIGGVWKAHCRKRAVIFAPSGYHGGKIAVFSEIGETVRHTFDDTLAYGVEKLHTGCYFLRVICRLVVGGAGQEVYGTIDVSADIGVVVSSTARVVGSQRFVRLHKVRKRRFSVADGIPFIRSDGINCGKQHIVNIAYGGREPVTAERGYRCAGGYFGGGVRRQQDDCVPYRAVGNF